MGIEKLYEQSMRSKRAMAHHMPHLRKLASNTEGGAPWRCVEFGVRAAYSTIALLAGGAVVESWDIEQREQDRPTHEAIRAAVGDRWTFHVGSSLDADFGGCDLLLIDSLHNFAHLDAELRAHADKVLKCLVFHDTITFGSFGQPPAAAKNTGMGATDDPLSGIRLAIDHLMIRDPSWRIVAHDPRASGMLTLWRTT